MPFGRISQKGITYAATTFGNRLISSIFFFYYVKVVIDLYHMHQVWFQISQFIFAIWNAVNDPWFGYLQDTSSSGWILSRRKCILYGALPWVISFLIPWFPWADYSVESNNFICFIQGLSALCLFDTFYTFVLLSHCALMTEYGETDSERLMLVKYAGIAGIIGSSSVFFADYISSGLKNYIMFQTVCVFLSVIALMLFVYTGMNARTKYDDNNAVTKGATVELPPQSYWSLTKDIFRNKNFLAFVAMNFMQELHITYVMSFAKIFSEQMIPSERLSASQRSFLLGSLVVLPQIFVVLVNPIICKVGLYRMEMYSFYSKIILGLIMYMSGAGKTEWFLIFLIADFTLSDGFFTFFSINLSDVADEDQQVNSRKKPIASMIFGSNALVVKPALSLSPMVVAGIMDRYGYELVKSGNATADQKSQLQNMIFHLACFAPVIIGIAQIFIWRIYTLRGDKSESEKSIVIAQN